MYFIQNFSTKQRNDYKLELSTAHLFVLHSAVDRVGGANRSTSF